MSARLIIVRHAQTTANLENRFQGQIDTELSAWGEKQLELLGKRLAGMEFDAVYSSPLKRTVRTAEACLGGRDLPIELDDRLKEINGGVMEGQIWDELAECYPEQMTYWRERSPLFEPEGGESMVCFHRRLIEAILHIAAANEGRTAVVVTHGCAARNIMCWAKGLPIEQLRQIGTWSNTGIGIVEVTDGVPTLLLENDHAHLAPLEGAQ